MMIERDELLNDYPVLNLLGYMDGEQQKRMNESLRTVEHQLLVTSPEAELIDPDLPCLNN
jgi:hypothetical protein